MVDYGRERGILVTDLDQLLSTQIVPEGLYLAAKKQIKKSSIIDGRKIEPDSRGAIGTLE